MVTGVWSHLREMQHARHGPALAIKPCVVRLLLALPVALAACSPAAVPTVADHPASRSAPVGRLAPAPPAIAPGVAGDDVLKVPGSDTQPPTAPSTEKSHDMGGMKMGPDAAPKGKP